MNKRFFGFSRPGKDIAEHVIGAFWNGVSIPAGTTYSGCPFKVGVDVTSNQFPWPDPGIISDMAVRLSSPQPGTGSLVVTLYVDGLATLIVVTIAAGSAAGTYSDNIHKIEIRLNSLLRWDVQNNALAGSANLTAVSMKNNKKIV